MLNIIIKGEITIELQEVFKLSSCLIFIKMSDAWQSVLRV